MPPVALNQSGEHGSVGIRDVETFRLRAGGQQLISCDDQSHAGTPDYADFTLAHGTEHSEILWPQHPACFKQARTDRNVFATPAYIFAG